MPGMQVWYWALTTCFVMISFIIIPSARESYSHGSGRAHESFGHDKWSPWWWFEIWFPSFVVCPPSNPSDCHWVCSWWVWFGPRAASGAHRTLQVGGTQMPDLLNFAVPDNSILATLSHAAKAGVLDPTIFRHFWAYTPNWFWKAGMGAWPVPASVLAMLVNSPRPCWRSWLTFFHVDPTTFHLRLLGSAVKNPWQTLLLWVVATYLPTTSSRRSHPHPHPHAVLAILTISTFL